MNIEEQINIIQSNQKDIIKQLDIILSNQKQLEITNKRLRQRLQSFKKRNGENNNKIIESIEESIRRLGNRIGILEKQVERILLYKSPEKD
jgi:regulator of replication initiation timing